MMPPIQWTPKGVTLGDRSFAADHHVPVLIYPNPLNPKRYVVLNALAAASGLTQYASRERIFVLRRARGGGAQPDAPIRIRFTYEALSRVRREPRWQITGEGRLQGA